MSAFHLPKHFAVQSCCDAPLAVASGYLRAGGVAAMVESFDYPHPGLIRITGLQPRRHYLLGGATHRFVRADAAGVALIGVRLEAPTIITVVPVV